MSTKLVALGGGTGLPKVIKASIDVGFETSAVVNVVDDGGSSGELRKYFYIIPPGDIRNCLTAVARNEELANILNYRFDCECDLNNHSLGNLFLVALFDICKGFKEGIDKAKKILDVRVDVIPVCCAPLTLTGVAGDGNKIEGQINVANTTNISHIYIEPDNIYADVEAISKIEDADIITIGPGSLFSSILPTLLVPGIQEAINRSKAYKVFFCNTVSFRKETLGYNVKQYLDAFRKNAQDLKIDLFAINNEHSISAGKPEERKEIVKFDREGLDINYQVFDFADDENPRYHSVGKITSFLENLLKEKVVVK